MSHQDNAGQELREKIEMYRNSIIHADKPELAAQVWAVAPETSLIHPRGHEHGWDEIRENFYRNTMAKRFSTRDLRLTGEPVIHVYGDAAVAEFDWEFTATLREGGVERRTSGRESQVYVRRPGQGLRLVHVHYSGPAATA
ncbi:nuclear transport factor 2 family protein [uncultured Desulfovibrio sp.]|uniref:YybH family protein n=1 Tax=uncultured Desulfovibrio sp. TaxID=167968 RepID=UPI00039EC8DF|nr:nuclear transport factor 2 family protein [uncultured Desulfovibrio sp.]